MVIKSLFLAAIPASLLAFNTAPSEQQAVKKYATIPAKSYICRERDQLKRQNNGHLFDTVEILTGIVRGCTYTKEIRVVRVLVNGEPAMVHHDETGYWWVNTKDIRE